jgi:hypothetical protein
MQLTEHFSEQELGVEGAGDEIVANAKFLCETILEPIRAQYPDHTLKIHDGYRPTSLNIEAGGKLSSFHLFEGGKAAADFDVPGLAMSYVFNWIRLTSDLPFHKIILEYGPDDMPACIHIQIDRLNPTALEKREALSGRTGDCHRYDQMTVS